MKLSAIKTKLKHLHAIKFQLPDGELVPEHFHVTEIGEVNKRFIDCGGTVRNETVINFQLWQSTDYDHRLQPEKLLKIIELSEEKLGIGDHEVEVEYQGNTIQIFGLDFNNDTFVLLSKMTACLAPDKCGIPQASAAAVEFNNLSLADNGGCTPGSGCC